MHNSDHSRHPGLASSAQLLRSTFLAAASAAAILVTVVLPADYGIDPTGAGQMLGLTDMGVTKAKLAAEAEADRKPAAGSKTAPQMDANELMTRVGALEKSVEKHARVTASGEAHKAGASQEQQIAAAEDAKAQAEAEARAQAEAKAQAEAQAAAKAQAKAQADARARAEAQAKAKADAEARAAAEAANQEAAAQTAESAAPAETNSSVAAAPKVPASKTDSMTLTLAPGQGAEVKLVMKKGAKAGFAWAAEGGPVNFDKHGDGPDNEEISYQKGKGVKSDTGIIVAATDGVHGWFWRNRGEQPVKISLDTNGDYSEMKRVK